MIPWQLSWSQCIIRTHEVLGQRLSKGGNAQWFCLQLAQQNELMLFFRWSKQHEQQIICLHGSSTGSSRMLSTHKIIQGTNGSGKTVCCEGDWTLVFWPWYCTCSVITFGHSAIFESPTNLSFIYHITGLTPIITVHWLHMAKMSCKPFLHPGISSYIALRGSMNHELKNFGERMSGSSDSTSRWKRSVSQ